MKEIYVTYNWHIILVILIICDLSFYWNLRFYFNILAILTLLIVICIAIPISIHLFVTLFGFNDKLTFVRLEL